MPPIAKKDKQWQFVGNEVRNMDDLTMDHIRAIYGLGPFNKTGNNGTSSTTSLTSKKSESVYPYCGNQHKDNPSGSPLLARGKNGNTCIAARCKEGNPHCLNYMGQEQWEKEDAFDEYYASFSKKSDPEISKRKPNSPAGMKNLGATCYANSLLQVWFHDLPFRDAIYRSRFRADADKSLDALYQLQHLFAHLDCGTKDTYNPLSLVTSLKLDTRMQQDAQEFCNLFMALIDNHLQSQEDVYLRSFIKNQFQGHYSYITTCKKCKKSSVRGCTFYELMLNIKENCILMDCFDEFVEAEDLVGSDRYSCSFCESLQDATRKIKLDSLPKVLNIQLMRFVYDTTTWTKKKSKDMIRFPLTIDFASLLGSQTAVLYDLSAVLVHSGPSAHSGHFMAHVLDKPSNKWFVLNDEEVTEFDSTVFDPEDYAETSSKSKAKKKTMKAGATDAERLWDTLSSRNAYMLTYTKRTSEPSVTPRKPPSDILDLVMVDNAVFDSELKGYTEFKEKTRVKFEQDREGRRKLYCSWDVNNDEDDSCYVSSAALSKYMQLDGGRISEDGSQREDSTTVDLDSNAVACEHRKLCPTTVSKSKRISMCLNRLTAIFGPMELPKHDAPECQECRELQKANVNDELVAAAALEKDELKGFMKRWEGFTKDPAINERPTTLDNSDLLCKHDLFLFDLNNPADKKHNESVAVIREDEWSFLITMYEGGPEVVIMKQEFMETDDSSAQDHGFFTVRSTPSHCPECRLLDFSSTTLIVRIYNPGEPVVGDEASCTPASTDDSQAPTPTNGSPRSNITMNTKSKRKQVPIYGATGTRQSKRIRTGKIPYVERTFADVSKNTTVMDLKMKASLLSIHFLLIGFACFPGAIMELKGIVPLYQKLLYGQVELDENERTIAELAIPPGAVLNVLTFDQDVDDLDLDKFHNDTPAPGDVGGFGGTGLTENWL
ncbi:Ubiquitin carboxyl-terminal hydrolase 48 [Linnemannia schmuckeri]|uniref:Ubiquitin carboxyl-terminal hydrolase n=1 Tax=Linnemannia schmuckeri TaxID=64567 RepID=A0A9P5RTY0_9FUNG|nr:Ubiquitin carboxyl-terminal hydrolase 48 [Linnemannia schmuckeri]